MAAKMQKEEYKTPTKGKPVAGRLRGNQEGTVGKDLRRSLEGEGAGTSRFHLGTEMTMLSVADKEPV